MARVYRLAWRVIAVADAVRRWLIDNGEVSAGRIVTLHNPAAALDVRAKPRQVGEALRLVFVGRLEPIKNVAALVRAVATLVEQGRRCVLTIVGDGSEAEALRCLITELRVTDQVRLVGYQRDPAPYFAAAHVCVLPSLVEGMSLTVLEAMSCGLPVIAPEAGGASEVIQSNDTGWLLPSSGVSEIVAALERVLAMDADELAAVGERARQSIAGRFSPSGYVRQLEALYSQGLTAVASRKPSTTLATRCPKAIATNEGTR